MYLNLRLDVSRASVYPGLEMCWWQGVIVLLEVIALEFLTLTFLSLISSSFLHAIPRAQQKTCPSQYSKKKFAKKGTHCSGAKGNNGHC